MDARENSEESLEQTTQSIAEHSGVVSAHPIPGKTAIEIEYDPAKISQQDLRRIVGSHAPGIPLQKRTLRLEGNACEACAIKLEKKVKNIPGVRKATATYIGKILCLTFDENIADEKSVMDSLRALGARITTYQPVWKEGEESLWNRVKSGSLNEEISCVLGFLFLIASALGEG
jgi:Cd2+/Zn2+-exporting ATPase